MTNEGIAESLTEPRNGAPSENSGAAEVLEHIESIFERALHMQTEPLQRLIEQAQRLVAEQIDHLARIKGEAQLLLHNGEKTADLAAQLRKELDEMKARHAERLQTR